MIIARLQHTGHREIIYRMKHPAYRKRVRTTAGQNSRQQWTAVGKGGKGGRAGVLSKPPPPGRSTSHAPTAHSSGGLSLTRLHPRGNRPHTQRRRVNEEADIDSSAHSNTHRPASRPRLSQTHPPKHKHRQQSDTITATANTGQTAAVPGWQAASDGPFQTVSNRHGASGRPHYSAPPGLATAIGGVLTVNTV